MTSCALTRKAEQTTYSKIRTLSLPFFSLSLSLSRYRSLSLSVCTTAWNSCCFTAVH